MLTQSRKGAKECKAWRSRKTTPPPIRFRNTYFPGAVTQGCARLPDLVSKYFGQATSASLRFSLHRLACPPTSTDPFLLLAGLAYFGPLALFFWAA